MNYSAYVYFALALTLASCSNKDLAEPLNLSEYRSLYLEENKETFDNLNPEENIELTTKDGVTIQLPSKAFKKDNFIYTDHVTIEFLLITDKANMILSGMGTVAKYNGTYKMLKTCGEYYINAYDTDTKQELDLVKDYTISIPNSLTDSENILPMRLFRAGLEEIQFWNLVSSNPADVIQTLDTSEGRTIIEFNSFGWFNGDAFIEKDQALSVVEFQYPNGLSKDNALTFISLKGFPFSMFNIETPIFHKEKAHLICISRIADKYHYTYQEFTTSANMSIDFRNNELETIDVDKMEDFLIDLLN